MFIQVIQGKCHRPVDLRRLLDRWHAELGPTAPGWLGGTYGFADRDTLVAVVRFESRETAEQNATRIEQEHWFNEVQKVFTGPLQFHDCDDVTQLLDGGSDSAGFVQVICGRVLDKERLRSTTRYGDRLRKERPDVIGATLAIADDGTFFETVSFTDEEAARRSERQQMPQDLAEDLTASTADVTFLDLHEPWFASRS